MREFTDDEQKFIHQALHDILDFIIMGQYAKAKLVIDWTERFLEAKSEPN